MERTVRVWSLPLVPFWTGVGHLDLVPGHLDLALGVGCKGGKGGAGQVNVVSLAAGAGVCNLGTDGLAVVLDTDVATAILGVVHPKTGWSRSALIVCTP